MARATLNKGYLAALKAAAEPSKAAPTGKPLRISLDRIEEDPSQPRTAFDEGELTTLVASIGLVGILQPVGVRPLPDGRWRIVHGARRVRAAKLAGLSEVPAVPLDEAQDGLVAQVIENQVRVALPARDLAAAINRMFADRMSIKAISSAVALPEYVVNHYRAVERFQPELLARLDRDDIRALYELHKAWANAPTAIATEVAAADERITVSEARRIIARATSSSSLALSATETRSETTTVSPEPEVGESSTRFSAPVVPVTIPDEEIPEATVPVMSSPVPSREFKQQSRPSVSPRPVFIVSDDERRGRLVTDHVAKAAGHAVVQFGDLIEEVPVTLLRIVEVGIA